MKTVAECFFGIYHSYRHFSALFQPLFTISKINLQKRVPAPLFYQIPTVVTKIFRVLRSSKNQRHIVFNKCTSLSIIDILSIWVLAWPKVTMCESIISPCNTNS